MTFHERIKDEVLSQFIDISGNIDAKFRKRYNSLSNYIDSMIEKEQDNSMELEAHPDYAETLDSFLGDLSQCLSVTYYNDTDSPVP
jgi:hypothetical protein